MLALSVFISKVSQSEKKFCFSYNTKEVEIVLASDAPQLAREIKPRKNSVQNNTTKLILIKLKYFATLKKIWLLET